MIRAGLLACLLLGAFAGTSRAARRAQHLRFKTPHGAVHVWKPAGYDAATAGIVLYVHGYFTDVDHAWREHRLAAQFAAADINALFIACEAPSSARDPINWVSGQALLDEVTHRLGEPLPEGRIVAVGHSGAHRTIASWLEDADLFDTVMLLDALYGEQPAIRAWIEGSDERRLIDVGELTRAWTEQLHAALPETVIFDHFPPRRRGHLPGARDARVVYVRSHLGHMPLVTGGLALPMVLRASRLASLHDGSRSSALRRL